MQPTVGAPSRSRNMPDRRTLTCDDRAAGETGREERALPHDRRDVDGVPPRAERRAHAARSSCTTRSTTSRTTRRRCRSRASTSSSRRLGELGYEVVDLDAVLDHYTLGTPLPAKAVLITFDDGYRDILENALPVLDKHGYPAVIFVPVAYMEDKTPLPHETHLIERGMRNPTLDWGLDARARRGRRAGRVARHRAPPARRGQPRRVGARDRRLEAEARGAARPPGARLRLREGLRGALPPGARVASSSSPATRSRSPRSRG